MVLAAALAQRPHWWIGPIAVPLGDLVRLAGPEDDALVPVPSDEWEGDVEAMQEELEHGWEPPPLLAQYRDGQLLLQDGNHRYEALAREHESHAWTLVFFDDPADQAAFLAASTTPSSSLGESPTEELIYLEVWTEQVTADEDPEVLEPALGGPDTSVRGEQGNADDGNRDRGVDAGS